MKYKIKIYLIKFMINLLGYCTLLAMFSYMIFVVMTFTRNTYNMENISRLFVITMISYCFYLYSINKIINKYNKIHDLEGYKNYIKEMIYIRHTLDSTNILTVMLILSFIVVIITYAIWYINANLSAIEAGFDYIVLVCSTTINLKLIANYVKNFKYFDKRLHNEVFK